MVDEMVDFTEGASYEVSDKLGPMDFEDAYDEKYLVVYTIVVGQLSQHGVNDLVSPLVRFGPS